MRVVECGEKLKWWLIIVVNFVVDVLYAVIDPRLKAHDI